MHRIVLFICSAFALLILITAPPKAADSLPLAADPSLNQMLNATLTYSGAAYACYNSTAEFKLSKRTTVRLFEHAKKYGLLSESGIWVYQNLTTVIEDAASAYKKSAYITCGEVSEWVPKIDDMIEEHYKVHKE